MRRADAIADAFIQGFGKTVVSARIKIDPTLGGISGFSRDQEYLRTQHPRIRDE
jgi:hypothetical protein